MHTETDFQTALGVRLKQLRVERELTQEEIAEMAGIRRRQWARWELGLNAVPAYSLYRLARALGISADELLPA